ncbi:hypothetical protein AZH46_07225 [Corynebacterium striatum]|nr:hypothetical protein AZH46_07225 [Corynebacterium striatum]
MGIEAEKQRDGKVRITDNAEATRQHIQSTLSRERTNTVSEHMISITRRIKDIFERANGGIDMPVETYAAGGHRDKNVDRAVARRANSNHEPSHTAHIAPAGSYRVFAESETGGEATSHWQRISATAPRKSYPRWLGCSATSSLMGRPAKCKHSQMVLFCLRLW